MHIAQASRAARSPRRRRTALAGACLLGTAGAFAATQITPSLIANGGNTAYSPAACYQLTSSIGQPAVGTPAHGGPYSLQGGFLAGNRDLDSVFRQSFEVCI
jgi:hypothetical protein